MKTFKIGDQVTFTEREGHGIITEIRAHEYVVEDDLGFQIPVAKNKVIARIDFTKALPRKTEVKTKKLPEIKPVIEAPNPNSWESHQKNIRKSKAPLNEKELSLLKDKEIHSKKPKKNKEGLPEIDLHFHHLVQNEKKYSDHEKLEIQMDALRDFIQKMQLERQYEFIVIHGVGTGRLKTEIREYIQGIHYLHYEDASYKKYGLGATRVFIRLQAVK